MHNDCFLSRRGVFLRVVNSVEIRQKALICMDMLGCLWYPKSMQEKGPQ